MGTKLYACRRLLRICEGEQSWRSREEKQSQKSAMQKPHDSGPINEGCLDAQPSALAEGCVNIAVCCNRRIVDFVKGPQTNSESLACHNGGKREISGLDLVTVLILIV